MTRPPVPPDRATRAKAIGTASLAVIVGLLAFSFLYLVVQGLFVFTETRSFVLYGSGFDIARFFLFPDPAIDSSGRLLGGVFFQGLGRLCGVEATCVNATEVALLAVAAALLVIHTVQISGSPRLTFVAAALWVIGAPVLGAALWQSTAFDKLVVVAALSLGIAWWALFGRRELSRNASIGLAVFNVPALAIAYNAKETAWFLVGILVLLAVIRGLGIPRGVHRNLLISAPALAYSVWFVAIGITRLDDQMTVHIGSGSITDNLVSLTAQSLSLGTSFMNLGNWGTTFELLQTMARILYGLSIVGFALLVAVTALVVARRAMTSQAGWRANVRVRASEVAPEIYLAAVLVGVMALTARARFPSAYYMMIPYWAATVLGLLIVRRLARLTPWPVPVAAAIVAPFALAAILATASHYGDAGAVTRLRIASDRVSTLGATVRTLLDGRDVRTVRWRSLGPADSEWFLLRGGFGDFVRMSDIWPFLMHDATQRPDVEGLLEGSPSSLLADAMDRREAGEVLMVTDSAYKLALLAYQGELLFPREPGLVGLGSS